MRKNRVKEKLNRGEVVTCFWMSLGAPIIAEVAARLDIFDSVLLDFQHGYWNEDTLLQGIQVVGPTATVPLVRVAKNDFALIGRALDMGAMGILVPMVNSGEEAAAVVNAMRYPPEGNRSVGGHRIQFLGEDYVTAANDELLAMVMLETREAVDKAEEILSVPGVDLGFIGPGDLALSLGCWPDRGTEHDEAVEKVLAAGKKTGKPLGILALSPEEFGHRVQQGFCFVPHTTDARALVTDLKETREKLYAYVP